jgi:hypothetical protein
MNGWSRDMKTPTKRQSDAGELPKDKFGALLTKGQGSPIARVNVGYSESTEFGANKVSASVTLECDQTEASINKAAELAYYKAREIVDDGWSLLQLKPST